MMQANWSLILNVLLLIGVIGAIWRLMNTRKQSLGTDRYQPASNQKEQNLYDPPTYNDDIIAVRKVNRENLLDLDPELEAEVSLLKKSPARPSPQLMPQDALAPEMEEESKLVPPTLMMFLLAKENRQFAGYELLQTVLAAGLRFGEGQLFHRHQFANGQGPVLCSLAAATPTGVFDLHNIGAFSVRGLCLFMHTSKNSSIDGERFSIMLETARQLSEGMDAYLLDDNRKPLTEERIAHYYRLFQVTEYQPEEAIA